MEAEAVPIYRFQLRLPLPQKFTASASSFRFHIPASKYQQDDLDGRLALQRWSRGHKAWGQGQGHKKILRPRPRTDPFEAKAKDQGHRRNCSQKKRFSKFFFRRSQKKTSSKMFFRQKSSSKFCFRRSLLEETKKRPLQIFRKVSGVFQRNFNGSKIVLFFSRGQGNFRGLEDSRPRPRTSKCVLEDSTSGNQHQIIAF